MNELRVVTLNIWNRSGPWDRRLPLIQSGLLKLAPSIVGLQEVILADGRTQAHDIGEGLGFHVAYGVANDLGDGVQFGNAILSRWPITRQEVFPLPSGGSSENRSVVFAEIASPHGKIPFFCTHLNWMFHEGIVREQQVVAIADFVKQMAPTSGLPPILVGDLNAEPEASEIRFLKGLQSLAGRSTFFGDCFGQVGEGPGITFDARNNPFAAPTHEYPRRIDYVMVRGPDSHVRGKPLEAGVCFDEVVDGVCASDHYGVWAEISI